MTLPCNVCMLITELDGWRSVQVAIEMERLVATCERLTDTRRQLERAVAGIEGPLHIVQECLYHREKRQGTTLSRNCFSFRITVALATANKGSDRLQNIQYSI